MIGSLIGSFGCVQDVVKHTLQTLTAWEQGGKLSAALQLPSSSSSHTEQLLEAAAPLLTRSNSWDSVVVARQAAQVTEKVLQLLSKGAVCKEEVSDAVLVALTLRLCRLVVESPASDESVHAQGILVEIQQRVRQRWSSSSQTLTGSGVQS